MRFKMRNWRLIDGETLMWFQRRRHLIKGPVPVPNFPTSAVHCEACRDILDVLESLAMEGM